MQTIFAYRQSKEANYGIAKDFIKECFEPDLNSMEVQDKELLKKHSKEAQEVFKANYEVEGFKGNNEVAKINTIVEEAIKDYHKANDKDFKYFKKNMIVEAEKITDRYISILNLILEFARLAEEDTRINHQNFVKNLLIQSLKFNTLIENITLRRNLNWSNALGDVRQWFRDLVKTDEEYKAYLKLESPSFDDDKQIVLHIVKGIIFKSDLLDKYFEESDLNWQEDRAIIKSLVTKTIKSIEQDTEQDFELQELSYNWEDDKSFFQKLFEDTIEVEKEYRDLIAAKTENWDIERIATTDRIVLEMAISEMINFPSIPVKVTINEYIEVAKRYSTPKSKLFINGVLDVIASDLTKKGTIRKSGRGLIDNK